MSDGHSENSAGAARGCFSPRIAFFNIKKNQTTKKPKKTPTNEKSPTQSLDFCLILDAFVERLPISENIGLGYHHRVFSPRLGAFHFFQTAFVQVEGNPLHQLFEFQRQLMGLQPSVSQRGKITVFVIYFPAAI